MVGGRGRGGGRGRRRHRLRRDPLASGTINACYTKATGQLCVIDTGAGQSCRTAETALSWQQSAPVVSLACPAGTALSTGVCIETTGRAAATHSDAEDTCATLGRRLPSPGELTTFRGQPGIQLDANGEWTDDLGDIATASTFKYFVISQNGNGVQLAGHLVPYRCVAGMLLG